MTFVLWRGALSCWRYSWEDGTIVATEGCTWLTAILTMAGTVQLWLTDINRPKVCHGNILHTIPPPPAWVTDTRQVESMDPCWWRQTVTLPSVFTCPMLVSLWLLSFLCLAERSGTWQGCFCVHHSCTGWLSELPWPFCQLEWPGYFLTSLSNKMFILYPFCSLM